MPKISIIIPCFNEERTIRKTLEAILAQTYPLSEMEVVIADGLSTDRTREVIHQFIMEHPELAVRVVDNPKRFIPNGLNTALNHANGVYIARMDGHSVPDPNYIALAEEDLEAGRGDNVGGVVDILPGNEGWLARAISIATGHPLGVGDALYRFATQAGEVDTVAFGVYRRELFDRIGGWDESLLINEDYELNTRIRQNGGKIWLNPSIRAAYFSRSTLGTLSRQYFQYGLWKWRMLKRYPGSLRWRQALPPVFVLGVILGGLLSIFAKAAFLIWAGVLGLYATILFLAGILQAIRLRRLSMCIGFPLAVACMHISWGTGFLWSMITPIPR